MSSGAVPAKRTVTVVVANYLSRPRFQPYLAAANGDADRALALYQWNTQLAAAFQEVLANVEIIIRNAIDLELQTWNATRGADPDGVPYTREWALHPAPPLAGVVHDALETATKHARRARSSRGRRHPRKRAPISHDDVVAQLSFSVWRTLMPAAAPKKVGLKNLWSNALVHAFPHAGGSAHHTPTNPVDVLVHDRLERLITLRNRVAHMENLLEVNVPARLTDCLSLLSYVSPHARDWCAGASRVTEVNAARP